MCVYKRVFPAYIIQFKTSTCLSLPSFLVPLKTKIVLFNSISKYDASVGNLDCFTYIVGGNIKKFNIFCICGENAVNDSKRRHLIL